MREHQAQNLALRKNRVLWFLLFFVFVLCDTVVAVDQKVWRAIPGGRLRGLAAFNTNSPPGFKQLHNADIGVSFTNTLPHLLASFRQFSLNGAGVALGDFDNDGLPDVFFCNKGGPNKLYRNLGLWHFQDVTEAMGLSATNKSSTGALFADSNGDGWQDLVITVFGESSEILINNNGKSFTKLATPLFGSSRGNMTSIAASDVDGDGRLDLYFCNFGLESIGGDGITLATRVINGETKVQGRFANRAKIINGKLVEYGDQDILLGNLGDRGFQPRNWEDFFRNTEGKPLRAPWDFGLAVQIRDINGDGAPDIYVCNDFQTPDRLWLNDKTGKFKLAPTRTQRTMAYASMGVDFADINRDGLLDFITVEMLPKLNTRRVQERLPHEIGRREWNSGLELEQVARNCLYLNVGDGTYSEIAQFAGLAATDWSWTPLFLDVDLDGFEDLLVTNGNLKDMNHWDAIGADKTAHQGVLSKRDLPLITPNAAYRNQRDLTFSDMHSAWGFNATNISQGMATADLDGDGDLDVVVNCLNSPPLFYRNESSASRLKVKLAGSPPNRFGVGAQILVRNGAVLQSQEIICGGQYLSASEMVRTFAGFSHTNLLDIEVRWRNGRRSFLSQVPTNTELEVEETSSIIIEKKGHDPSRIETSLFSLTEGPPSREAALPEFDDYATQPLLHRKMSHAGPGLAVADFNQDGRPDLLVGAKSGGKMTVELNLASGWEKWEPNQLSGFGEFGSGTPETPTREWNFDESIVGQAASVVTWTNSSGELNLAATISSGQGGTGQVRIARLRRGQLVGSVALLLGNNPSALAVGDLNGDGKMELFVGGASIKDRWPMPSQSVLLRETKRGWERDEAVTTALGACGLVSAAQWVDINGDHQSDLVTVGEWGAPQIYINKHGVLQSVGGEWGVADQQGWWNGLAAGDFDRDGKLDLLISNWGLNTPWSSASNSTIKWGYGDRDGASSFVLIEAAFDPLLRFITPQRSLGELAEVWTGFRERFPTHASFSAISIDEAWGHAAPRMQGVEAKQWNTTLFLNRGNRFEARPLPQIAQLAPAFGIGVADLNGDGFLDAVLAQNFFALRPGVSRCDAGQGLVLLGDGGGGFRPLTSTESGVATEGEQRAVVIADFNDDGEPDFAVSEYGQPVKIWQTITAPK